MPKRWLTVTPELAVHRVEEFYKKQNATHNVVSLTGTTTRTVLDMLHDVGIRAAVESDVPDAQIDEVVTIFRAGLQHAPGRIAALQDAWPALYEALSALAENYDGTA